MQKVTFYSIPSHFFVTLVSFWSLFVALGATQKVTFEALFRYFTIVFKIITRMKLLFLNYLGDYSYSFQGSSELISITVAVSLFL